MAILWYAGILITFVAGAGFAAMTGIGGGVLYTPLQILYGIDIREAAATSQFLIVLMSLSATITYRRARKIDWTLAFILEIFTVAGSFTGGYFSQFISPQLLTGILVIALIGAGILMFRRTLRAHVHDDPRRGWYLMHRTTDHCRYTVNLLIAAPVSTAAGIIAGMIGIGGGVIQVPMLVVLFGVPIDIVIATSTLMVGITALGGFAGHALSGHWNWAVSLILAPTVIAGAQAGSHLMLRTNKATLKKIFAIFLHVLAAAIILASL